MTNKIATQIVMAAFHELEAATQVADALQEAKKDNALSYRHMWIVRKNDAGKVKVQPIGDPFAGLRNEALQQIGNVILPGNSAIITVFEETEVDKAIMKEVNQDLTEVVTDLSSDLRATLRDGQDVAYLLALTADGIVASRLAVGEEVADIQTFIADQEGVIAGQAVATATGMAYEVAAVTEDDAAYEAGVATDEGAAVVDAYAAPKE